VTNLNSLYPQADFGRRAYIAPHTQVPRVSTGLELQVLMPVVNAPFRLYFAYNPSYVNTVLTPPVVADRSFFPNNATYQEALSEFGTAQPFHERRTIFRFSIGRTF
jgi:outer membrane protein insertion porin family